MELTGTNRPKAYFFKSCCVVFAFTVWFLGSKSRQTFVWFWFSVVIARGKHPVPFRTRKLRLFALMVLHFCGCGRVGRRRFFIQNPQNLLVLGIFCLTRRLVYDWSAGYFCVSAWLCVSGVWLRYISCLWLARLRLWRCG